jgi:hypothetical protein
MFPSFVVVMVRGALGFPLRKRDSAGRQPGQSMSATGFNRGVWSTPTDDRVADAHPGKNFFSIVNKKLLQFPNTPVKTTGVRCSTHSFLDDFRFLTTKLDD